MDLQSAAYRTVEPRDLEPGGWEQLIERGAVVPYNGDPRPREAFEADDWDRGRQSKKSASEAATAAMARGDDPSPYAEFGDIDAPSTGRLGIAGVGGIWVPWLPDAARLTGYPVVVNPSWDGHGHGPMRLLEVVVGHHTATPDYIAGDYPSLRVVRDGRSGLPGPLAHYGIGRSGAVYVIGNGLAYHAGVSEYAGYLDINDEAIGIEAEDGGDGTWTAAQWDCYPRLVAAILYYLRRPAERYCSHRTCALPEGRKPDPAGIADSWMHDKVRSMLANPATISRLYSAPQPALPARPTEEDDTVGAMQVQLRPGSQMRAVVSVPPVRRSLLIPGEGLPGGDQPGAAWFSLNSAFGKFRVHDLWFVVATDSGPSWGASRHIEGYDHGQDVRKGWELPTGTSQVSIYYSTPPPGAEGSNVQISAMVEWLQNDPRS